MRSIFCLLVATGLAVLRCHTTDVELRAVCFGFGVVWIVAAVGFIQVKV